MTERTWAGIVNAPGGNVIQGDQIAEKGDVYLGQLGFLFQFYCFLHDTTFGS